MKKTPDYTVIYSDDSIVVLNKRSGLLIAADRYDLDAPRLDLEASKEFGKLYAVHRIDKDTSGVIIYARDAESHKSLSEQFEKRQVNKTYHCLVHGHPMWETLHVDMPLQPDGDQRHRTVPNQKLGKPSITDFRLLGVCGPYSWIEAKPKTGRTHQIRVHLAKSGFPILCDSLYSGNQRPLYLSEIKKRWRGDEVTEQPLLSRLALHAYSISFTHPKTGEKVSYTAPYHRDMEASRKQLKKVFGVDPINEDEE